MANAYVNQKKLDTETKILQANAAQFSKQTVQWLKLVEDFNTALKVSCIETWHNMKQPAIMLFHIKIKVFRLQWSSIKKMVTSMVKTLNSHFMQHNDS